MNAAYQYDPDCYQSDIEHTVTELPSYRLSSAYEALCKEKAAHEETKLKLTAWRAYAAVLALCVIGQSINIIMGVV